MGGSRDAGVDRPADTTPPAPDAAPDAPHPTPGTVDCGTAKCMTSSQLCCVTAAGPSCVPKNDNCALGAARTCDGPEDCASGRVCCVKAQAIGGYFAVCARLEDCSNAVGSPACRTVSECPGGWNNKCEASDFGPKVCYKN